MNHPVRYAAERLALRLLFCVLLALAVQYALPLVWNTLSPFIIALPIAATLQPLIRFFEKKLHLNRGFAVAFWVILFSAVAFFIVYWFVSFAVGQVVSAATNATSIINSIVNVLREASDRLLNATAAMPESTSATLRDSLNTGFKWLTEQATQLAGSSLNMLVSIASGLPSALIYANFFLLGVYFITKRYPDLRNTLLRKRASSGPESNLALLRRSVIKGTLGYIRVQVLWLVLLFTFSTIYFQLMGFPYAALVGLLAALLELIPQFGCGVLYLPWAVVSFIIRDPFSGWAVLCFYVAYSLLRRILDPKLLGDNLGMSPLFSLVGMFAGLRLGGVIGLILGPIAMLVLISAIRARLFDGILADVRTLTLYMKMRWSRGSEAGNTATNGGKPDDEP
jgi:sporulation integral membrane protein YtvI